ncbi:MAG: ABC transporter substrate-binding protein [Candidatus Methanospirareceae archaeon]
MKPPKDITSNLHLHGRPENKLSKSKTVIIIVAITIILGVLAFALPPLRIPQVPQEEYGITVTDDFGRNVTIKGEPERIVSLSPAETEILFALGLGDKVVGVTEFCNYPPEALKKEKIGGMTNVNIEKVVNLSPDLILAVNLNGEEVVDRLDDYFPVFVIDHRKIRKVEDIFSRIEIIGNITGAEEKAKELVEEMRRKVEEIENKTRGVQRARTALVTWHEPIWVTGSGNFQADLLDKAGGENVFADIEDWGTVSLEEFIERDPDVIIVSVGHGAAERKPYEFFMNDERLKGLKARKEGRIYTIDADIISRPGPRVVEALEEMAKDLHPELW